MADRRALGPGPPVDLVGHDWDAILTVRAVSLEPRLVRTWAAGAAPLDAEYEWHRVARLWQTPGVGEQVMATLTPDAMAAALRSDGVPQAAAAVAASRVDDAMKRAILGLYRSAVDVGRQWEGDLAKVSAPGPVLWGERDPFAAPRFGEKLAARTGARFVGLSRLLALVATRAARGDGRRAGAPLGIRRATGVTRPAREGAPGRAPMIGGTAASGRGEW